MLMFVSPVPLLLVLIVKILLLQPISYNSILIWKCFPYAPGAITLLTI